MTLIEVNPKNLCKIIKHIKPRNAETDEVDSLGAQARHLSLIGKLQASERLNLKQNTNKKVDGVETNHHADPPPDNGWGLATSLLLTTLLKELHKDSVRKCKFALLSECLHMAPSIHSLTPSPLTLFSVSSLPPVISPSPTLILSSPFSLLLSSSSLLLSLPLALLPCNKLHG